MVGNAAPVTLRVTNGGPDRATAVRVQVVGARLDVAASAAGGGAFAGGYWDVGSVEVGAQATLTVTATAIAAGAATLVAQVAGQGEVDADSFPANGAVGEDDQATAAVAASAPPRSPPTPAPGRARADRLTLMLSSTHDRVAPYTATAAGRLVATALPDRIACTVTVTVTGRITVNGRPRTLLTRTVRLRLVDGACQFAAPLSVTRKQRGAAARTLTIAATFSGNAALLAATARTRAFRLG